MEKMLAWSLDHKLSLLAILERVLTDTALSLVFKIHFVFIKFKRLHDAFELSLLLVFPLNGGM